MHKQFVSVGIALALLASPLFVSADTISDLKAQIQSVKQQIQTLQSQLGDLQGSLIKACIAPPHITVTSPISISSGVTIQQSLTADETVTWSSSNLPSWARLAGNVLSLTGPTKTGTYSVTLTARNSCGTKAVIVIKINVTTAPVPPPTQCKPVVAVDCAVGYQPVSGGVDQNGCQLPNTCAPIITPGPTSTPATLDISTDPSSPSYRIVSGGATGVILGVIKLHATGENMTLGKLGLILSSGKSPDLNQVYLYSGSTLVGTVVFTGTNTVATSTLTVPLSLPSSTDVQVTVKGDIANIGVGQPGTPGDLIQVNALNYEATGNTSGTTMRGTASTNVAGVRIFRSYPTVTQIALPSTGIADGRLLRFAVTASPSGPVGLAEIAVNIAGLAQNANGQADLYAYADSAYSIPIPQFVAGGINGLIVTSGSPGGYLWFPKPVEIPAGATYYFELRDSTKGTGLVNGASVLVTTLLGQSTYSGLYPATSLNGKDVMFIWSPNSTTTSQFSDSDWTNGYGIAGLSSSGITQARTAAVYDPFVSFATAILAFSSAVHGLFGK